MTSHLVAEIAQHLNGKALYPSSAWIQNFLSTARPNTPLPALKQTALFRLLAADITTTLDQPSSGIFPKDILTGTIQCRTFPGPIICQILDIEDIGQSRWSQVQDIEAKDRGETTKGREIIRVVEQEGGDVATRSSLASQLESRGPFKILLQDAKNVQVYALDLKGIEGVSTNMSIGSKIQLRNVDVRRGVVMLEPGRAQLLGGKLDSVDKLWKQGRKERLTTSAKATQT